MAPCDFLFSEAARFRISNYKCVDLPPKLWKVTHGDSQSRVVNGDIVAANNVQRFDDEAALQWAVQNHVDWNSRLPSSFISVFTDEDHAWNWARQRCDPVHIYEIDTTQFHPMLGPMVLDMELLMAELDIYNPYSQHELLFLRRIPATCIISIITLSEGCQPEQGEVLEIVSSPSELDAWSYDPSEGLDSPSDICYSDDPDFSADERDLQDDLAEMMDDLAM